MNAVLNSPFRYAGGKFYARRLILEHVPAHTTYIEPFAGGASIFFAKPKIAFSWLNDRDSQLINVYLHIRDRVEALIDQLRGHRASKTKHNYFKNVFQPNNDLERAVRWYYLNRTSYSGIMNPINCYWGYGKKYSMVPQNWPPHLRNCSAKLQGIKLTDWDFERVIEEAPNGSFLFIDPPYFNADQDKFYTVSFSKDEHFRLQRILKKHSHRIKFLLTYDNSPEIRDLYGWSTEMLEKEWNYTINRTDDQKKNGDGKSKKGKRYRGKEIFIMNYEAYENVDYESTQLVFPLYPLPGANVGRRPVEHTVFAE